MQNKLVVAAWGVCGALGPLAVRSSLAHADEPYTISGFTGVDIFSRDTELGNSWMVDQVPQTSVLVGLRLGWIILPSLRPHWRSQPQLELEAEFKLAPAFTANGSTGNGAQSYFAPVFGWRGHALASVHVMPWLRAHVLAGVGGESIASTSPYMADETDLIVYCGVGLRLAAKELSDTWRLRLDARQGFTAGRVETFAATVELQLGIETTFGAALPRRAARPHAVSKSDKKNNSNSNSNSNSSSSNNDDNDDNDSMHMAADDLVTSTVAAKSQATDAQPGNKPDADADGIQDIDDKCPDAAEIRNGFRDDDGCPDEVPAVVRETPTINFPRGSAKLGPLAARQLAELAVVLREASELKLNIVGHDTGGGKRAAGLRVRRITSIQWFLLDRGITAERITSSIVSSNELDHAERIELHIAP